MLRNTAREIAIHLSYELSFNNTPIDTLLDQRLTAETFFCLGRGGSRLCGGSQRQTGGVYPPLGQGVDDHAAELDSYISKYAKGWNFDRIPLVASAIMRVAMYEVLYMPDIPNSAAINEAVEIAKNMRHRRR